SYLSSLWAANRRWSPTSSAAIAVTTSATTVSLRPTTTTDAPSRPNASAAARPIPLVAPVTMTVFPVKVMAPSLADCRSDERSRLAPQAASRGHVSYSEHSPARGGAAVGQRFDLKTAENRCKHARAQRKL